MEEVGGGGEGTNEAVKGGDVERMRGKHRMWREEGRGRRKGKEGC